METTIKSLPALAVRGVIPMPSNDFRIEVGRKKSLDAIKTAEDNFNQYIIILIQKNPLIEDPKEDIHEYGALAKVAMKIKLPNGNYKIKFNILNRIKIKDYFQEDEFFVVNYDDVDTIIENDDEELTLVKMVVDEVAKKQREVLLPNNNVIDQIQSGVSTVKTADIIAGSLKIPENEKYKYLEEESLKERFKLILTDLNRQQMINEIERKINEDVKKSIN